jgi:hypothetical protein
MPFPCIGPATAPESLADSEANKADDIIASTLRGRAFAIPEMGQQKTGAGARLRKKCCLLKILACIPGRDSMQEDAAIYALPSFPSDASELCRS